VVTQQQNVGVQVNQELQACQVNAANQDYQARKENEVSKDCRVRKETRDYQVNQELRVLTVRRSPLTQ
jgi:hypothetical protein